MNHFFAYLDRLKLIRRWGLMRNTVPENDMEHSMQTALIAHGLAVLGKTRHQRDIDPAHVVVLALYHDVGEVITGDLPTPVKYKTPGIQDAYAAVEADARSQLMDMLPEDMRPAFRPFVDPNQTTYEWRLVKAADRISAYVKCLEEYGYGSREFLTAQENIRASISQMNMPEAEDFMREFAPSFMLPLDALN